MESIILYHNNSEITLCKRKDIEDMNLDQYDHIYDWDSGFKFKHITDEVFNNSEKFYACLISEDFKSLYEDIKTHLKYIEAAGGIVKNKDNELLVIHRFGIPDLPKGKIESGEKPAEAAIREVEEECGIKDLTIVKESNPTFHLYKIKGKEYLKKTFWYEMTYKGKEKPTPQTEESITAVEWCNEKKIESYKNKTYKSLRRYFK